MLEILSPAGSPEGVVAAVQNGADAVYLEYGEPETHKTSARFTRDEFGRALEYCRVRGVKTYLVLEKFSYDGELQEIANRAKEACRLGIDAIIVQDLGVMIAVRAAVPDVPMHAGVRMGIHNLEGVRMAAAMGFRRAVLAPELSRKKIAYICKYSPIEVEVVAHGSLCICYSGNCFFSSMQGGGADSRGECGEPCRMNYDAGGNPADYPLSMKDYCLVRHLEYLDKAGVTAARIEGLSKPPEYSAIVTGIYSKAAQKGKTVTQDDLRAIQTIFSHQGFTDGYLTERVDSDMLGKSGGGGRSGSAMVSTIRKNYLNGELQRVPVRFVGTVSKGKKVKLAAADDRKNTAVIYGPVPEIAFHKEMTVTSLQTQLYDTKGTPYYCAGVKGKVEPGLSLPLSVWDDMRRKLLEDIHEQRKTVPERSEGEFIPTPPERGYTAAPALAVSITKIGQLSPELLDLGPSYIYIPLTEISFESAAVKTLIAESRINVTAALPRIIHDHERKNVSEMLVKAKELGVSSVLAGNIGHIQFARSHGMRVRGDYGLNVLNSESLKALGKLGLISATLSFELLMSEIRDIAKLIDTEMIVYGRFPLMVTESCIIKNTTAACTCDSFPGLRSKKGALFPVVFEFGCRNVLLNSKKLYMADKRGLIAKSGLWAQRLMFTTENALECAAITKRYMGQSDYAPSGYTRGVYFKRQNA